MKQSLTFSIFCAGNCSLKETRITIAFLVGCLFISSYSSLVTIYSFFDIPQIQHQLHYYSSAPTLTTHVFQVGATVIVDERNQGAIISTEANSKTRTVKYIIENRVEHIIVFNRMRVLVLFETHRSKLIRPADKPPQIIIPQHIQDRISIQLIKSKSCIPTETTSLI